jgi:hypothetical protein
MPSRAILVGDRVRVPFGLDTVDGVVEDVYEHGSSRRVVVRIAVPGASEDGETVTLPADDVELRDEAEAIPPGTWVTGAQYERKLGEALQRLLPSLPADAEIHTQVLTGGDRGADYVIQSGNREVLIEAKTGTRQAHVTTDMVNQLRRLLSYMRPRDVAGLLVTDLNFTPSAQRLLRQSSRLRAVRWRSPRDDKQLAAALASLLSGKSE